MGGRILTLKKLQHGIVEYTSYTIQPLIWFSLFKQIAGFFSQPLPVTLPILITDKIFTNCRLACCLPALFG